MKLKQTESERESVREHNSHTHTPSGYTKYIRLFSLWQWEKYRAEWDGVRRNKWIHLVPNSVDARICVCGDLGSGSSTNTNAKKCRQTHNGFVHGTYVHTKIHHHLTTTASFNRHKTKNYASFLFHFVNIVVHLAAQAVAPTARWILKTFITAKDAGIWTHQS